MKKLLSILISAILAVSVFAISASARVLGDVNGDKTANSADALNILRYSVGTLEEIDTKAADVNCDGNINSADALTTLMISVGSYSGPTNVDLKPEIIEPITGSGKYTITTSVDFNGVPTPTTIMINGKNMCAAMTIKEIELENGKKMNDLYVRLLILDGNIYLVLPNFLIPGINLYAEVPKDQVGDIDLGSIDLGNIDFGSNQTYSGSRYEAVDEKTYTVDTYKNSDGSKSDYYFLNGKWVKVVDNPGTARESVMDVQDFKAGVDSSWFSLDGFKKVNWPTTN